MEKKKIVGSFEGKHLEVDIVVDESFAVNGLFPCGYHIIDGIVDGRKIDKEDLEEMDLVLNFVSNKLEETDGC